jgi:hypothetical protein
MHVQAGQFKFIHEVATSVFAEQHANAGWAHCAGKPSEQLPPRQKQSGIA